MTRIVGGIINCLICRSTSRPLPPSRRELRMATSGFRLSIIAVVSVEFDDSPTTVTPGTFSRRFRSLPRREASMSARIMVI